MQLGVPRETAAGDGRVAVVVEAAKRLVATGLDVLVETGAGRGALIDDEQYRRAGAAIAASADELYRRADIVVKINPPDPATEIDRLGAGAVLIAMLDPLRNGDVVRRLAERGVGSFSLDLLPRITRAQSMDALTSMSTIAGYRAAVVAAGELAKMIPMMVTAAGTLRPATALVIGAGVAGLQAVATLKRMGAVVTAADVRPAAAEQVASLGAKFVPMAVEHAETDAGYAADLGEAFYQREQEILAPVVAAADIVITTALIPGRPAPRLITEAMVAGMSAGSVVIDLAATAGGNCTLSQADRRVEDRGVLILAPTNLPAGAPVHASMMYARNVAAFLGELLYDGRIDIDLDNEILRATLVTRDGEIVNERVRRALNKGVAP